jgi:anti-sigma factor RsiW
MTTCDETRISLGVYLVGAIDPAERAAVDEHLRNCARCRAELADLAMLPAILDQLSVDDLGEALPAPVASERLFARVAARVDAEAAADGGDAEVRELHRRPRWHVVAAAAAAVLVLGGASVTAVEVLQSSSAGPKTFTAANGPVQMRVAVASQATGSTLRVAVSGLDENEHCWLYAVADDGSKDLVGRWEATYAGEAQVTGSTSIAASHLARLVLEGDGGRQLVAVPI